MAHHREMLENEARRHGASGPEAGREAAIRLGGQDQIAERWRDQRGWRWVDDLRRDFRVALRSLRRAPGFTAVVVVTLALGIGANTAIFSLLDTALLQKLPVENPDQLTLLYWSTPQFPPALNQYARNTGLSGPGTTSYSFAYPTYAYLRDHSRGVLSSIFGFAPLGSSKAAIGIGGRTVLARGAVVTGEFFTGLGLHAARGRVLTRADEKPGAPAAAVLSYGYWTRQFGRDTSIIGRNVTVNDAPATIVGVAPPGFQGVEPGQAIELWVAISPTSPAGLIPWGASGNQFYHDPGFWWLQMMVRRRPGVTPARAEAELAPAFQRLTHNGLNPAPTPEQMPRLGALPGAHGVNLFRIQNVQTLWVLIAVAGLLLLLACVNVAALLLARSSARRKEIGVRMALGAGRGRLVRQLLVESILLSLIGGGIGALLAPVGIRLLLAMLDGTTPVAVQVTVDGYVVAFTVGAAVLCGVLFGLAPALRSTRLKLATVATSGRGASGQQTHFGSDKALAAAQVALSVFLLVAAGLFLQMLRSLQNAQLGFNPNRVALVYLDGSQAGLHGDQLATLYGQVQQRLAALPGVRAVTMSSFALLGGPLSDGRVTVPGLDLPRAQTHTDKNKVGAGFLATMEIGLRAGRDFTAADMNSPYPVAIVNQALAQNLFGDKNPLGRSIYNGPNATGTPFEIVGVAANARYSDLDGPMPPTIYYPFYDPGGKLGGLVFEIRTQGNPNAILPSVRQAVEKLNPALTISGTWTQEQLVYLQMSSQRLIARLAAFFGLLGLLLAAIGIEGTMAYAVSRRTSEIGIRMALGARRSQVLTGVLREVVWLALLGVVAGLLGAFAVARLLASNLNGVSPTDPVALGEAVLLMLAVAVAAGALPAWRAASVDPVTALRSE